MRLAIFDVDGTLTESAVDTRYFLRAFLDVCGIAEVDTDWSRYQNATDPGVFYEVFELHHGRLPSVAETERFRQHLIGLFRAAARQSPIAAIAGAPELLALLDGSADYGVAIAIGCWRDSARIKMASAGMNFDSYPGATADDSPMRRAIVELALARARDRYQPLDGAVYFGDGVWDARACGALGLPFIGIGAGAAADQLRRAGALEVFADLTDVDRLLAAIDRVAA